MESYFFMNRPAMYYAPIWTKKQGIPKATKAQWRHHRLLMANGPKILLDCLLTTYFSVLGVFSAVIIFTVGPWSLNSIHAEWSLFSENEKFAATIHIGTRVVFLTVCGVFVIHRICWLMSIARLRMDIIRFQLNPICRQLAQTLSDRRPGLRRAWILTGTLTAASALGAWNLESYTSVATKLATTLFWTVVVAGYALAGSMRVMRLPTAAHLLPAWALVRIGIRVDPRIDPVAEGVVRPRSGLAQVGYFISNLLIRVWRWFPISRTWHLSWLPLDRAIAVVAPVYFATFVVCEMFGQPPWHCLIFALALTLPWAVWHSWESPWLPIKRVFMIEPGHVANTLVLMVTVTISGLLTIWCVLAAGLTVNVSALIVSTWIPLYYLYRFTRNLTLQETARFDLKRFVAALVLTASLLGGAFGVHYLISVGLTLFLPVASWMYTNFWQSARTQSAPTGQSIQ